MCVCGGALFKTGLQVLVMFGIRTVILSWSLVFSLIPLSGSRVEVIHIITLAVLCMWMVGL